MPEKIAALRVERRPLVDGKPHPKNPRTHPPEGSPAWEVLRASLAFDYFDPLILNERNGMWVAGHLRQKVMLSDGFTHADVVIVDYDEETHLARLIAANKPIGDWNDDLLKQLAAELTSGALPASLAAFSEKDFAQLATAPVLEDDTSVAEELMTDAEKLAEKWQVQPGDLFNAGPHRLLCGDCTLPENWQRLLGDRVADMIWTDPPYNVNYHSIQQRRIDLKRAEGHNPQSKAMPIMNDELTEDQYRQFLRSCFAAAFQFCKPGGSIYVAHADNFGLLTRQAVADSGFKLAQCLIWVKQAFTLGRQDYQWQHEPILYGWKPGAGHYWQGGFSESTVLDDEPKKLAKLSKPELIKIIQELRNARDTTVVREPRGTGELHPTVKPLNLVARQIWNSSARGQTVLELFGGSGTTMLAAEKTGRRAVATELDPKYCAVILERLTLQGVTVEKVADGA